jgi:hypothetical protein
VVGLPATDDELLSLLAGANLLTFRLWGELATIEAAEDLARQAFDENQRMMGTPLGPGLRGGRPAPGPRRYLFNNLVDIETERAWFYQDAALARTCRGVVGLGPLALGVLPRQLARHRLGAVRARAGLGTRSAR